MVDGELTFYVSANKNTYLSGMKDYLPEGFDGGKMLHTGHLRSFTMPIKTVVGAVPEAYSFHHSKIAFLDANSWSFNYGHYFIDNVIPTFTAAKVHTAHYTHTVYYTHYTDYIIHTIHTIHTVHYIHYTHIYSCSIFHSRVHSKSLKPTADSSRPWKRGSPLNK